MRYPALILFLLALLSPCLSAEIPAPEAYFGFEPGTDRELIDYEELIAYLEVVDQASDRLELRKVGQSPMGRPIYVAFISSAANIANLEALREINERLALDPDLDDSQQDRLVRDGRVFFMMTLSMHSNEVGPSQALPRFAYDLATSEDPQRLEQLSQAVLMMVACHNPDGMDRVVEHYRKYKGTKYEGSYMPGLYHKYVGHDNNRDFITVTQSDNRTVNRLYSTEWFPQVLVEKHQMGSLGPRYFVPPFHDPIAENIDQGIWRWISVFGANMARDMSREGLTGVAQHWLFDFYWPGSTETSSWKNVISFLTESAGCSYAKPIFIEPTELRVRGKGLSEYKKSINMPDPWPGGWWRLGDIIRYELATMYSGLATAAENREAILRFRNDVCRLEVARGKDRYFVLPQDQHDPGEWLDLVTLLGEHGVRVERLTEDRVVQGRALQAGDLVVPLSQAYRPFIREIMEAQRFPVRHYTPKGKVIRPYDVTSWCLPLHRGLDCFELHAPLSGLEPITAKDLASETAAPDRYFAAVFPATHNHSYRAAFTALANGTEVSRLLETVEHEGTSIPAGSFLIPQAEAVPSGAALFLNQPPQAETQALSLPRIALVETWAHDMDAGWTRYLFDTYGIPFTTVRPGDFERTDFVNDFDVVLFPDANKDILSKGKRSREDDHYFMPAMPPEFAKGMGDKGLENLMTFLDQGGLIISWRQSVSLFTSGLKIKRSEDETEEFDLPVRERSPNKELYVPGAFLAIEVVAGHPLTYGMPKNTGVFSRGSPVLQTSIPRFDMDRRVLARFPQEDLLLSGYLEKEELIANTPALVWVKKGKGQLVLMSFNPQFRASTPVTYKLLFNALLLPDVE